MNIVVYTAIFGGIDKLWSVCPTAYSDNVRWVCFTDSTRPQVGLWGGDGKIPQMIDTKQAAPEVWEQKPFLAAAWMGARKAARRVKTCPHLFVEADAWIWLDGNVRLMVPPEELIKKCLTNELAIFEHPDRDCLYAEADFCAKIGKDKSATLKAQASRYQKAKMPRKWGLPETRCVIRLDTEKMRRFGDAWWKEIAEGSVRDQVSIPFVCWQMGIKWDTIPGHAHPSNKDEMFWYRKHGK